MSGEILKKNASSKLLTASWSAPRGEGVGLGEHDKGANIETIAVYHLSDGPAKP